jgi:hypothetical protein
LASIIIGAAGPGALAALISWAAGAWVVGGFMMALAFVSAIRTAANLWLYQRLVCLTGVQCAVGKVREDPNRQGLGAFDNDEFFDVVLMPHRTEDLPGPKGSGADLSTTEQDNHPENYVHEDGLQGQKYLAAVPASGDLPYDRTKIEARSLHCEAEGAFWATMKEWAWVMGLLIGAASAVGAAAGIATAAALCALGPLLCLLGILLGLLIWALSTAIGAAAAAGIMAIIFEATKGEVEDANVGDAALGPIKVGDLVVVRGEHVYDGFHEGWNEFHPLMTVAKLNARESSQYLEWNPGFAAGDPVPEDTGDMPSDIIDLEPIDMEVGLNSTKFAKRTKWMWDKYCGMWHEPWEPDIQDEQTKEKHRWTIHPDVDGCEEGEEIPPPR